MNMDKVMLESSNILNDKLSQLLELVRKLMELPTEHFRELDIVEQKLSEAIFWNDKVFDKLSEELKING